MKPRFRIRSIVIKNIVFKVLVIILLVQRVCEASRDQSSDSEESASLENENDIIDLIVNSTSLFPHGTELASEGYEVFHQKVKRSKTLYTSKKSPKWVFARHSDDTDEPVVVLDKSADKLHHSESNTYVVLIQSISRRDKYTAHRAYIRVIDGTKSVEWDLFDTSPAAMIKNPNFITAFKPSEYYVGTQIEVNSDATKKSHNNGRFLVAIDVGAKPSLKISLKPLGCLVGIFSCKSKIPPSPPPPSRPVPRKPEPSWPRPEDDRQPSSSTTTTTEATTTIATTPPTTTKPRPRTTKKPTTKKPKTTKQPDPEVFVEPRYMRLRSSDSDGLQDDSNESRSRSSKSSRHHQIQKKKCSKGGFLVHGKCKPLKKRWYKSDVETSEEIDSNSNPVSSSSDNKHEVHSSKNKKAPEEKKCPKGSGTVLVGKHCGCLTGFTFNKNEKKCVRTSKPSSQKLRKESLSALMDSSSSEENSFDSKLLDMDESDSSSSSESDSDEIKNKKSHVKMELSGSGRSVSNNEKSKKAQKYICPGGSGAILQGDRCYCPKGTVLKEKKCISKSQPPSDTRSANSKESHFEAEVSNALPYDDVAVKNLRKRKAEQYQWKSKQSRHQASSTHEDDSDDYSYFSAESSGESQVSDSLGPFYALVLRNKEDDSKTLKKLKSFSTKDAKNGLRRVMEFFTIGNDKKSGHPFFESKKKPFTGFMDCEYEDKRLKDFTQGMQKNVVDYYLYTLRAQCHRGIRKNMLKLFEDDILSVHKGKHTLIELNLSSKILNKKVLNRAQWQQFISAVFLTKYSEAFTEQNDKLDEEGKGEESVAPNGKVISHSVRTLISLVEKSLALLKKKQFERHAVKMTMYLVAVLTDWRQKSQKQEIILRHFCKNCNKERKMNEEDLKQLKILSDYVIFGSVEVIRDSLSFQDFYENKRHS